MPRRRRHDAADVLFALLARLPWWVSLALAAVSYALLHALARPGAPPTASTRPGQLVIQSVVTGLATAGQYLVPLLCLMAAAVSAWQRRQRQALVQDVAQADSADALNGMSWQSFEALVGEAFRRDGYAVQETGGPAPDGGVDLMLTKGSERFLVQCKQWKALKVGVAVVRELYGVMAARGATGGYVVTSGRYTDDAVAFAAGRNITLIDGPRLHAMLKRAKDNAAPSPRPDLRVVKPAEAPAAQAPACPKCGAAMVRRVAKTGARAGQSFWGCSAFPACRGGGGDWEMTAFGQEPSSTSGCYTAGCSKRMRRLREFGMIVVQLGS